MAIDPLPVCRACDLAADAAQRPRWLVRDLWTSQGVGFLAGSPKSMKTWLGLDLAISVASNTPCLDRFPVDEPGPVLAYLAEDRHREVRQRVAAICNHRNIPIASLALHFIAVPSLKLHIDDDCLRLQSTVAQLKPKLLLLDPLVRIWNADENSAQEISRLLGFLRTLQRKHRIAVLLVHHFTKRSHARLGQGLRGSGDIWAWSDDNAYLLRRDDQLLLNLEHRSAAAPAPITLRLVDSPNSCAAHLEIVDQQTNPNSATNNHLPLPDQILALLRAASSPLTRDTMRKNLRVNNQRLGQVLLELEASRLIKRTPSGWVIAGPDNSTPDPQLPLL